MPFTKKHAARLPLRAPNLRVVVYHCLNIKSGQTLEPTLKAKRALAKLPTLHAKLTFIPTG